MHLSTLLDGVKVVKLFQTVFGQMVVTHDVMVQNIQYDSRKVQRNDCFVAIRGTGLDGHRFLGEAVQRGAKVIVIEDDAAYPDSLAMHTGVVKVVVQNARQALARMAANYYGHPARKLTMIGVTGTNGKTTTTHLIKSILEASGERVGLIGTIEYAVGTEKMPAPHTTPESLELHGLLAQMVNAGCTSVSMEVSSHALHQSRVHGIEFRAAVFTNLTQDHLDYHGTMENYFQAKKILFEELSEGSSAITNADDPWGLPITASTRARTLRYGVEGPADVRASSIDLSLKGISIDIEYEKTKHRVTSPLVGRFNVHNILAAYTTGKAIGVSEEALRQGIASLRAVKGRLERVDSPNGWTAIIDYAHTPDALQKCLHAVRELLSGGRIITVFGAGGDRDKTKRPLMGRIAASLSDLAIVTSDNPRTEDPEQIIRDIVAGIPDTARVLQIVDRREAIRKATELARPGDVIVIAGKGHEEYQVIGTQKIPFSDRAVVEEFLR
jgi:UDP-N-acetylmuramoyl-L-alanyl-D-glutamate--2,6-diaminopimelate ligase